MSNSILCRTVIEVLGKPQEYVEKAMKGYIQKLKKDDRYKILKEDYAELKKQESDLWATFVEMDIELNNITDLISFCFEYMPSLIEIIKPAKMVLTEQEISLFFNDLQARLHQVDMIAKQVKLENEGLELNMRNLLKNYLTVLLKNNELTLPQLNKLTGVSEEKLGGYLDLMIDKGQVKMEKGVYTLKKG